MTGAISGVIDSHAHLDFPHYHDDREAMLTRMRGAGVEAAICIGTRLTHQDAPRQLAENHDFLWFTAGVHPNHAHEQPDYDNLGAYRQAVDHPKCVGIGEAGLDYFHTKADPKRQMVSFRCQLQIAIETGLPIVIHARDADEDMAQVLEEYAGKGCPPSKDEGDRPTGEGKGRLRGVMHCYSSGANLAETALNIGFYISFSGILTFNRSAELRSIAATIPDDRLLVETDAPYLTPEPMRKIKRNEPRFVIHTLEKLAEIKGRSVAEMAQITAQNTRRLFHKMRVSQTQVSQTQVSQTRANQ